MATPPPSDTVSSSPQTLAERRQLVHDSPSTLQQLSAPTMSDSTRSTTTPYSQPMAHSTSQPPLLSPNALRPTMAPRLTSERGRSLSADMHGSFASVTASSSAVSTPGASATPTTAFPSLLSSLAHHRLPRTSAPTSNPRIVRSASHSGPVPSAPGVAPVSSTTSRASHSPTRRRQSMHTPLSLGYTQTHAPLAPYLRPRGPSYLSTLPSPGFPLPHYLSHSAFASALRTGILAEGPKPVDYALPTPAGVPGNAPSNGEPRLEMPIGGVRMRRSAARHSDSDTSPTPTHRRTRSHTGGTMPVPSEGDGKDALNGGKTEKPIPDPVAPVYIPTKWHASMHSPFLTLSPDALGLMYTATGGNGDRDAGTALASHPIPPHVGVYYYEVEVVDKGVNGYISIGVCRADMPLGRLPGWEFGSWGYHGDDGHAFTGTHADTDYGPKFTTGDTIGCGVDFVTGTAFYTKNGLMIGPVFDDLPAHGPLYPCVGLRSPNESVRTNFGQKDFLFDIDGYMRRRKDGVLREVSRWNLKGLPITFCTAVKLEDEERSRPWGRGRAVVQFAGAPGADVDVHRRRARRPALGPAQSEGKTPKKTPKRESMSRPAGDSLYGGDGPKKGHKPTASIASTLPGTVGHSGTVTPERGEAEELRLALDALVLDYLVHQGFAGSAQTLAVESGVRTLEADSIAESRSGSGPLNTTRPSSAMDVDRPASCDVASSGESTFWRLPTDSMRARQQIMQHIVAGEIDPAIGLIRLHWPFLLRTRTAIPHDESAIEEDQDDVSRRVVKERDTYSELSCRLECRKFVELVLACAGSTRPPAGSPTISPSSPTFTALGAGQNPPTSPPASPSIPAPTPPTQELSEAFEFGRVLHHRYSDAPNPEMRSLVSRTFSLLGFSRPEEATGEVGALVGPGAREELAQWVNEVILRAEGQHRRPALARGWAQTKTVMAQLVALNVGKAAYLDVDEEFGAGRRGAGIVGAGGDGFP